MNCKIEVLEHKMRYSLGVLDAILDTLEYFGSKRANYMEKSIILPEIGLYILDLSYHDINRINKKYSEYIKPIQICKN